MKKNIFIKYLIISLALFTVLLCDDIYMIYNQINTDIPYSLVIFMHLIISFVLGVIVTIIYVIFFNFIYKIKLKNTSLYFLILSIGTIVFIANPLYKYLFGNIPEVIYHFIHFGLFPVLLFIAGCGIVIYDKIIFENKK